MILSIRKNTFCITCPWLRKENLEKKLPGKYFASPARGYEKKIWKMFCLENILHHLPVAAERFAVPAVAREHPGDKGRGREVEGREAQLRGANCQEHVRHLRLLACFLIFITCYPCYYLPSCVRVLWLLTVTCVLLDVHHVLPLLLPAQLRVCVMVTYGYLRAS